VEDDSSSLLAVRKVAVLSDWSCPLQVGMASRLSFTSSIFVHVYIPIGGPPKRHFTFTVISRTILVILYRYSILHRRTIMPETIHKSAHISICHTSSIICPCICNLQNRVGKEENKNKHPKQGFLSCKAKRNARPRNSTQITDTPHQRLAITQMTSERCNGNT
jgi:hypothetical protein